MNNISIYKPNKRNEGCACSFYRSKYGDVLINAIQQHSWDESKRTGSFSENKDNKEKSVSVKLGTFECGGIIRAISNYGEFSAFHSFDGNQTQISLTTWTKKDKNQTRAFGLSITRNAADKFKLPIELGEAEVIRIFLEECVKAGIHEEVP